MMINEKLEQLYKSHLEGLKHIHKGIKSFGIDDFAGPHLMYAWEDEYINSNRKILFVGQETNGWYNQTIQNEDNIIEAINTYKNFELGSRYNSLFWQKIFYINNCLNKMNGYNYFWTNINKFGKSDIGRPDPKLTALENEHFNVLKSEIGIIKPDVVIFISGPNYDNDIRNKLGEVIFSKCTNESIRVLARLESKYLPYHSYRTYHPGYSRRSGKEYLYDEVIKLIEKT